MTDLTAAKRALDEDGYAVIEDLLTPEQADEMRKLVLQFNTDDLQRGVRHFYNGEYCQRVWNLINKHEVFEQSIQHPAIVEVMSHLLEKDFQLFSFTANTVHPGAPPDPMHIDWPVGMFEEPVPTFCLCANSVWLLNDFTHENGATRVVPGSHTWGKKPGPGPTYEGEVPITGRKGSLVFINGHIWHGPGANKTQEPRVALLGFFGRGWMKPQVDNVGGLRPEVLERASPVLRGMLALDNQPQVVD